MDRIVVSGIRKTFQLKPGQYVTVDGEETDRVTVLDGVDLNIRKGEFITLVGPSGSGKSVLLDIIGGLTQASKGIVQLDGTTITRPDPKTGYVFQQYALFPLAHRAVEHRICAGGARRAKARTQRHARDISLLCSDCPVSRIAIPISFPAACSSVWRSPARLASNPEVLLMDEPFAALDAQTREILQSELLKIWEKINTTVIFVTHSIDEAIYLADRIVVMTARPGTVKEIIDIDLPRPRDGDIRSSTEFNAHRARVWEALRDEVNKAQKDWALSPAYAN